MPRANWRTWSANCTRASAACAQETDNLVIGPEGTQHARLLGRDPVAQGDRDGRHDRALRFVEQSTCASEDGALRPDVLVKLPGDKLIVVDSKVPLDAYSRIWRPRPTRSVRVQMARHASRLREHITKLASKGYQGQFDSTPDLVVMFVPSDGNYRQRSPSDPDSDRVRGPSGRADGDADHVDRAAAAMHYGWRQERSPSRLARSPRLGANCTSDSRVFVDPLAKVGRKLGSAVDAYNQAARSFDSRLTPKVGNSSSWEPRPAARCPTRADRGEPAGASLRLDRAPGLESPGAREAPAARGRRRSAPETIARARRSSARSRSMSGSNLLPRMSFH